MRLKICHLHKTHMHLETYKEVFCYLELRSSPKSIRADFLTFSFYVLALLEYDRKMKTLISSNIAKRVILNLEI